MLFKNKNDFTKFMQNPLFKLLMILLIFNAINVYYYRQINEHW